MDKKNRLSTDYDDEDMNWLDDDDDYLEEGGILSSLLFGDKKKKKRSKADSSRDDDRRSRRPTDVHEKREEKTDVSEPRRTRAASGIHGERTGKSVRSVRRVGDEQSTGIDNVYMDETASARDRQSERPARRRKISSDRTPVRLDEGTTRTGRTPVRHDEEKAKTVRTHAASAGTVGEYDEYYHENSRSRKLRDDRTAQKKENASGKHTGRSQRSGSAYAADSARTSVDNLLREVNNLEVDSKQRHEDLRREAWERTQRNVAKAKAEVERLELEREKNEKEEARKKKVREEMERRQAESEKQREQENTEKEVRSVADNSEEDNNKTEVTLADTAEKSVDIGPDDMGSDDAGGKSEAVESVISDDQTEEPKEESYEESYEESGEDDNITFSDNADESSTKEEKPRMKDNRSDMLNMDALEQIERDIDEDKLRYSESDTEDLGLGDIGRALGFDAVDLEDDEEELDDDEESDSEKFFRENLLDEADPKVVNPERKKINISTKVWAIAFFVLQALFIMICVIYVKNYARMKYNEMNINEISADQLLVNDGVKDATAGYRTIALYGVDSRDQNMDAGTNSDSIMIVSINESTKEIKLVSVYRDTLMDIASGAMNKSQKVNYAYQLGGAVTAINTLNTNLDLNITDYVAVDFSAMASIIDAVGGVNINVVDDEINNFNKNLAEQISISGKYSSGITQAGQYTLDGQQAVAYSRIRSTGSGDITRTERQRIILLKVIDKLIKADTSSLSAFVDVSFNNISTSLNKDSILDLVKAVAKYSVVDTAGFPFAYEAVDMAEQGNCLVAADMESNVQALHEYLYGNSHYKVSDTSKQISVSLAKETGVSAQKVKVESEKPGDGISDGKGEGDLRTITEPPKGMILDE
jgi:LCP family protein required for cell wall assembly